MVLEQQQDSEQCLTTVEPCSPTGVGRPVSFFVDVQAAGAPAVHGMPKSPSASHPTSPQDVDPRETGRRPPQRSSSGPRPASSGMRLEGVGVNGRKTIGQRLYGALQKLSSKVPSLS